MDAEEDGGGGGMRACGSCGRRNFGGNAQVIIKITCASAKHISYKDREANFGARSRLTFFHALPHAILLCFSQTRHPLRVPPPHEIGLLQLSHERLFA